MLFFKQLFVIDGNYQDKFHVVGFHLETHGNAITYGVTLAHIDF